MATDSVRLTAATSLAEGKPIFGVTYLDDELFVVRRRTPDIEVYDVTSYKMTRKLSVNGLRNPLDMAACTQTKRVYVVDGLDPCGKVFGVETQQAKCDDDASTSSASSSSSTSWSVGEMAMNASVTESTSVVVTCGKAAQLREFSSDGELLRQIALNAELVSAQHAVQLTPPDCFVVCHGWMDDSLHRVCVIDAQDCSGAPPSSAFGGKRGSASVKLLHNASHLAVDSQHQVVFVVDMGNRRVLALDSTLTELTDVPVDDKKRLPSRLCLDEHRGLVYVACNEWRDVFWTSGSVNVFSVAYKSPTN